MNAENIGEKSMATVGLAQGLAVVVTELVTSVVAPPAPPSVISPLVLDEPLAPAGVPVTLAPVPALALLPDALAPDPLPLLAPELDEPPHPAACPPSAKAQMTRYRSEPDVFDEYCMGICAASRALSAQLTPPCVAARRRNSACRQKLVVDSEFTTWPPSAKIAAL
jgi:hypothetical protein